MRKNNGIVGTDGLQYGIVKEFEDGTILWFEPVTDEKDGFVLRKGSNDDILAVYTRDSYPPEAITKIVNGGR